MCASRRTNSTGRVAVRSSRSATCPRSRPLPLSAWRGRRHQHVLSAIDSIASIALPSAARPVAEIPIARSRTAVMPTQWRPLAGREGQDLSAARAPVCRTVSCAPTGCACAAAAAGTVSDAGELFTTASTLRTRSTARARSGTTSNGTRIEWCSCPTSSRPALRGTHSASAAHAILRPPLRHPAPPRKPVRDLRLWLQRSS
jgi:hypothetical protein